MTTLQTHTYPTKFDKLEVYLDHPMLFNHKVVSRQTNRIRRPRAKKPVRYLSARERYLFK